MDERSTGKKPVINRADVKSHVVDEGVLGTRWTNLGKAAGTVALGLRRLQVEPGRKSTPVHVHTAEEEVFFVLGGTGLSWQDGAVYEIGAGDCLVHLPNRESHTLIGGSGGLDVLVFSDRKGAETPNLPRAGVTWLGRTWVASGESPPPYGRENAAGDLECPAPSPRPARIVALDDLPVREAGRGRFKRTKRALGEAAGSRAVGLNHVHLAEGMVSYPRHCHSAEEEVFVVLDGAGVFVLGEEEHELGPGDVVARPAGTGVAHALRGGPGGLTYLAFGERITSDTIWYPDSKKIAFGGLGVIARVEQLDYYDGEV